MVKIALWNHGGFLINYNLKSFFFLFYLKTVSFLILVCAYQIIKIIVGYVVLNKFDGIFLADQDALINSCCSNIQDWELIKPSVLFGIQGFDEQFITLLFLLFVCFFIQVQACFENLTVLAIRLLRVLLLRVCSTHRNFTRQSRHVFRKFYFSFFMVHLYQTSKLQSVTENIYALVFLLCLEEYIPKIFIVFLDSVPNVLSFVHYLPSVSQKLVQQVLSFLLKLIVDSIKTFFPSILELVFLNCDLFVVEKYKIL